MGHNFSLGIPCAWGQLRAFIRLSHGLDTLLGGQDPLAWIFVPKPRSPAGPFFLLARSRSANEEILQDELALSRGERLFANPAMDQSMREVGVSLHAHDLVARPAGGADKLRRTVLSHLSTPQ